MQLGHAPQGALSHPYTGSAEVANFGELKKYHSRLIPATNRAFEPKLVTLGHAPPLQDSAITNGLYLSRMVMTAAYLPPDGDSGLVVDDVTPGSSLLLELRHTGLKSLPPDGDHFAIFS